MRVLVCGGRDYTDRESVWEALGRANAEWIVQGGARGADRLAKQWAAFYQRKRVEYPADWATYGKAAGTIRNQRMLTDSRPNLVVAFPGGRVTSDMVRRARKAGVPVQEIEVTP